MSFNRPRIDRLDMSVTDAIVALSEGNPGAINVLVEMLKRGSQIDPDSGIGPMGGLFQLDHLDCYGSRIWQLFKDVCGQDIAKTLAVLRGNQLGLVSDFAVNAAIDGDEQLDADGILASVREQLPRFARVAE